MAGRVEPFRLSVMPKRRKAKKQIAVSRMRVVLVFEDDIFYCLDENRVWRTKPCFFNYVGMWLFTRITSRYVEDYCGGEYGTAHHVLIGDADAH